MGEARPGRQGQVRFHCNKWLQKESGWPVVYHGTRARPCIVRGIVREGFKIRGGKETAHNGSRYGQGVYCTPDPAYAVQYAKQQKLESSEHDDEFLVVFQCRVEPDSFTVERDTNDNDSKAIWRVTDPTNLRHQFRSQTFLIAVAGREKGWLKW